LILVQDFTDFLKIILQEFSE
jgi:hypothetical protein